MLALAPALRIDDTDRERSKAEYETAIEDALAASRHNQRKAAELLGVTYHQLRGLLKKHEYGRKPGKPKEEAGTPLTGPPRPAM